MTLSSLSVLKSSDVFVNIYVTTELNNEMNRNVIDFISLYDQYRFFTSPAVNEDKFFRVFICLDIFLYSSIKFYSCPSLITHFFE